MNNLEKIKSAWLEEMKNSEKAAWHAKIKNGTVTLAEYKGFLRETFFQAGQNPQIQAYATAYFSQSQRQIIKKFYQHAISEIAHDLLALNDLKALGEDEQSVIQGKPLPETLALTAYAFYQIQFRNPLGYLGYLFHLEFLPTQNGPDYIERFEKLGIPRNAMSFLEEHATVDQHHNRLMELYVDELVKNDEDLSEIIFAVKTACRLHSNMLSASFEEGLRLYGSSF